MPVTSSGQVSLKDVADEFGDSAPHSMSEFFGKGSAPASGETQLSDFYGAASAADYTGWTAGSAQSFNGPSLYGRGMSVRAAEGYAIVRCNNYLDEISTGSNNGRVEIYHNSSGTSWSFQAALTGGGFSSASNPNGVAISSTHCAVGASRNSGLSIWQRSGTSWSHVQHINQLSYAIDMTRDGSLLVVGEDVKVHVYSKTGTGSSTYTKLFTWNDVGSQRLDGIKVSGDGNFILACCSLVYGGRTTKIRLLERSGNTWVSRNYLDPPQIGRMGSYDQNGMSDDGTVICVSTDFDTRNVIYRGTPGGSYTSQELTGTKFRASSVSPDGKLVAMGGRDDNKVYFYSWNGSSWTNSSTSSAYTEAGVGVTSTAFDNLTPYVVAGLGRDSYFTNTLGGSVNFIAD